MNKLSKNIWGRDFELDVIYKVFDNAGATEVQEDAISKFNEIENLDDSLDQVKQYVFENDGKDNGIVSIDNIFKYVMPKCIYVPKAPNRVVAVLCDYKFDPEHGMAVVYENEEFSFVGEEGTVI